MSGSIWERFPHDPRHPEHAPLRASDRDRDVVNDVLGAAYADGRLTPEELDERGDQVAQAKTLGELPPIIRDLVATREDSILSIERDLEKKERKKLEKQRRMRKWLPAPTGEQQDSPDDPRAVSYTHLR